MSDAQLTAKGEDMAWHAIRKLVQDTHGDVVDDLLQEAKMLAHRHASQFKGQASYDTWFHRIAVNRSLMYLRKYKRHQQALQRYREQPDSYETQQRALDSMRSEALNPEERMIALERNELLREAILGLTPKLRLAVLMFATEDRRQGPKHHGVSNAQLTNAQKSNKFRAIRVLRKKLKGVL